MVTMFGRRYFRATPFGIYISPRDRGYVFPAGTGRNRGDGHGTTRRTKRLGERPKLWDLWVEERASGLLGVGTGVRGPEEVERVRWEKIIVSPPSSSN